MRIGTDLGHVAQPRRDDQVRATSRKSAAPSEFADVAKQTAPGENADLQAILGRREDEIKITEALAIAQMAQNVLLKAMEISLRLRNIASDAMASRKIDYTELTGIRAEMESSLGVYAQRFGDVIVVPPVRQVPENAVRDETASGVSIGDEIRNVKIVVEKMTNGDIPNLSEFDKLSGGLRERNAETAAAIEYLQRNGNMLVSRYNEVLAIGNAEGLARSMPGKIVENPGAALRAQANINTENTAMLRAR